MPKKVRMDPTSSNSTISNSPEINCFELKIISLGFVLQSFIIGYFELSLFRAIFRNSPERSKQRDSTVLSLASVLALNDVSFSILCSQDYTLFRRKIFIMFFNYCSFGLSMYFFFRHEWYCEPGSILLNFLTNTQLYYNNMLLICRLELVQLIVRVTFENFLKIVRAFICQRNWKGFGISDLKLYLTTKHRSVSVA